jgi:hypothetical protein
MNHLLICTCLFSIIWACEPSGSISEASTVAPEPTELVVSQPFQVINPEGKTLETRFNPPPGYQRKALDSNSFGAYLRQLPLKEHGAYVKYYDGQYKRPDGVYTAVVDQPISARDLQQCADAVMRLRGEYLYAQKKYEDIHFNFLSDGKPRYFLDRADAQRSYKSFLKYMDYIFSYANTGSLHKELKGVSFEEMQIGDVFIVTGRPYGHAIIVVDMAENEAGKKLFMLAQSYMPAQETQILINPNDSEISPWYSSDFAGSLSTPEWRFEKGDLRRFAD